MPITVVDKLTKLNITIFQKSPKVFFSNADIYNRMREKTQNKKDKKMFENAEIISVYTAQQAEEDGFLVNVTETAKEAGFKWTTRISNGVHNLCTPPKSNKIQSYEGRLWDVLYLARMAIKRSRNEGLVEYRVKIGRKIETLWITIDGTMGEPAIHIITPSEY